MLTVDVATYFNSLYHHDIVQCLSKLGWAKEDVRSVGRFLREINSGRSIDCLPHRIHPCKVIGAEFLRIVDNCYRIKSPLLLRFLDDIYLFSDSYPTLVHDLYLVQELLGEKGLSINSAKTFIGPCGDAEDGPELDEIQQSLRGIRATVITEYGEEDDLQPQPIELTDDQLAYLLDLLADEHLSESDAELCLVLLRDHTDEVLSRILELLRKYPALVKSVYNYAKYAQSCEGLDELVVAFLNEAANITEHQLLWLAKLAEDFLPSSPHYGQILMGAYMHQDATVLSKSKILEIPEHRFGLPEVREEQLRTGHSNWICWAAACGTRNEDPTHRNHLLGYFANGSSVNALIAECIQAT